MKVEVKVDIKKLINEKEFKLLKELLKEQEPARIVEMIEELPQDEKIVVFRFLPKDTAAEVFSHLEKDDQMELLSLFKEDKLKEIIENMEPDDRADLLEELPANVVKRLLAHLSNEERQNTLTLLNYPEYSAGRIMNPNFLDLKENMTVKEALQHIKVEGNKKETIYTLFVIDNTRKLKGTVELKDLIFSEEDEFIKNIMNENPIYSTVYDDEEEVARIMQDYDLLAIPVTDSEKRLVGIITIDDIVDVLEESATEDIQKMAAVGVTETSYFHTSIWALIKSRVIWLGALLLFESIAVFVIEGFSDVLQKITVLAAFMPTINAIGGNTGSQMSAIVIRSMAVGDIEEDDFKKVLSKELFSGIILGIILGIIMFLRSIVNTREPLIMLSLSLSIIIVVMISNLLGAILPFFAKKIHLDPALISGPFISTLMDILSMFFYFSISALLLKDLL
ncbi:magnesium transporter [Petrotoga miotherma DSM 10691]|uniref:Magnesium transporter MgtE n=2 Tax=Petrotoga TaxID=28236 RepID=A0A2K1PI92_9BACT|nr:MULTISPECIES: magnesium transporter [Petrotoga]MDN5346072.1 magnesium transporter [Petrotoga sp.]PNS02509.1 magnesium transporter [Petrotoga miotherma DSM 10691]POZ91440.1 magnesium transporter [Petrotoga halophila DSM 16923]